MTRTNQQFRLACAWLNEGESYVPPVGMGEVMRALGVGRVIASRRERVAEGDHVSGLFGTQRYAVAGDSGLPGMFSSQCREGGCWAAYREHLGAPLPDTIKAVAIYSRSDGIVSWEACLDPCARHVEVNSSHTGMSVNRDVYRVLADVLEEEERRWSG